MLAVAELQAAAEMHRQQAGRKCEARDAEELRRKQEDGSLMFVVGACSGL